MSDSATPWTAAYQYSAIKKKKKKDAPVHVTMCMTLKNIMLHEISQTLKEKYCTILLIGGT